MDSLLSFARRILLILAALPASFRPLPKDEQTRWDAGLRQLLSFDRAWPLALLLAGWYFARSKRPSSPALGMLRDTFGISAIWSRFDSPRVAPLLERACKAAYDAQEAWEIAGAGAAFQFALDSIGLDTLKQAVSSTVFSALAKSLMDALPAPSETKVRFREILLGQAAPPTQTASRPRPAVQPVVEAAPLLVAATELSQKDACMIHLRGLGYSEADAERLCAGPQTAGPKA